MVDKLDESCYIPIVNITQLKDWLNKIDTNWAYRGQPAGFELETSRERYCNMSCLSLEDYAYKIECYITREFRREYAGPDQEMAKNDTKSIK
jgi:hypothetical protein